FEGIRARDQFHAPTGAQGLVSGARAAPATTDEGEFNGVTGGGPEGKPFHRQGAQQRPARKGGRRGFEEASARDRRLSKFDFRLVHNIYFFCFRMPAASIAISFILFAPRKT